MDDDSQSGSFHEQFEEQEDDQNGEFVIPQERTKLKACSKCFLLKTDDQWKKDSKCENCGVFEGDVMKYVTKNFDGIVCLVNPESSWIRKKLKIRPGSKLCPGAYAMNCSGH